MKLDAVLQPISYSPEESEALAFREAPWLLTPYSNPVWVVADTYDHSKTATIDFQVPLFHGRLLTETPRLCESVKDYAFWIRDPRFSRIDDADAHKTLVQNLIHTAHSLSIDGIASFAHLQPYDIERLIPRYQKGLVGVLLAQERIKSHLASLAEQNAKNPKPFGGLPEYIHSVAGKGTRKLHVGRLLADCNIPAGAAKCQSIAALLRSEAKKQGMLAPESGLDEPSDSSRQPITAPALKRWLDPLEQMYAMRRHIRGEAIAFRPYPNGASRIAAIKGAETARTETPPPRLALHLLTKAADHVLSFDPAYAAKLADQKQVLNLATACWIMIASFSARRDREIDDLRSDCLVGNDRDGWWLSSFIGKTLQRDELIPVPPIVARAVQALKALSQTSRIQSGTDAIFQWLNPTGRIVQIDVGRYLDKFAAHVNVPAHVEKEGKPTHWHWHPHQFRRFFAILYFYRFEGATIEALSHHLRHFNIEMTRRYVMTDPEAAALWMDVEWGYMGHIARQIVAGERSVAGAAGSRLKKTARRLLDVFRRHLTVVSPDRVATALAHVMQRKGLVLTPKPWVTCTCPRTRDAAHAAACRSSENPSAASTGPNFANAGPTVCTKCPHGMTDTSKRAFMEEEIAHTDGVARSTCSGNTIFGTLQQARVIKLTAALQSQY